MTTHTGAKTLGFQFTCSFTTVSQFRPSLTQAPPYFPSFPLPSTTLCGNFFSLRNSCIQKENELNYEDDWRGKRYDLRLDPQCDVQSWSLQKIVGLDESMREEPLDGNSACRRRGRKQIPLFFHCVRTCQVGGYLQVREDLKVLRTQISGGWEQTLELPFQTQLLPHASVFSNADRRRLSSHLDSEFNPTFLTCFFWARHQARGWSFDNKREVCWPGINRLPFICPAKMGLFGFSKELQFRVCNHGKPHTSFLHSKGRRTLL